MKQKSTEMTFPFCLLEGETPLSRSIGGVGDNHSKRLEEPLHNTDEGTLTRGRHTTEEERVLLQLRTGTAKTQSANNQNQGIPWLRYDDIGVLNCSHIQHRKKQT